jgi:SAM-dependent methyltransferase
MRDQVQTPSPAAGAPWVTWCCSYCGGSLLRRGAGLFCPAEDRSFATESGVHRLLAEERRREIRPFVELYQRVRREEGWRAQPGLPEVPAHHPHAGIWRQRASRFQRGLSRATRWLGHGRWRVLDVGAGCCWAAVRLLEAGHLVAAVDVNLDPDDGLLAANQLVVDPATLPRAEADMEALPLPAGAFDLVLAGGSLHYASDLSSVLVELRRVTRRGGLLLALDSPVFRRMADGEAMVETRMEEHLQRYAVSLPRKNQSSYLLRDGLEDFFRKAGWRLEVRGWPGRLREWARDRIEERRHGRRTARFPLLLAQRMDTT